MLTFYIAPKRRQTAINHVMQKADAETIALDYTAWAKLNGSVTTATWTKKSGQLGITDEALASNVATALITAADVSRGRIIVQATNGTQIINTTILLRVIEPVDIGDYLGNGFGPGNVLTQDYDDVLLEG